MPTTATVMASPSAPMNAINWPTKSILRRFTRSVSRPASGVNSIVAENCRIDTAPTAVLDPVRS